ncbi:MAG: TIGR03809 family protein [Pseudolabrys sp.]|jgi:uncharacterized repeat protein (TIGR03809 family)
MSAEQTNRGLESVARKWRDLAARRRAYFIELYRSGRWRHYYSEEQFTSRMRDVLRAAKTWDELAAREESSGSKARPAA